MLASSFSETPRELPASKKEKGCTFILQPPKTDMELENHAFEKEVPLLWVHLQVSMLVFGGVSWKSGFAT